MPRPITAPTLGDRAAVAGAGLCSRCASLEVLRSPKSAFVRCRRSDDDPRFERYPRLPILACPGFEPARLIFE